MRRITFRPWISLSCLICAMSLFMACPTLAIVQFGVYFDEAGTQTQITTSNQPETIPVYLIIHEPEATEHLTEWECRVSTLGNSYLLSWELAGNGINQFSNNEFRVYLPEPLPPAEITVVATGQLLVTGSNVSSQIYLHSLDEPSLFAPLEPGHLFPYPIHQPAVARAGQWYAAEIASGCEAIPVAIANDDGILPELDFQLISPIVHLSTSGIGEFTISNTGLLPFAGTLSVLEEYIFFYYGNHAATEIPISIHLNPGQELLVTVSAPEAEFGFLGYLGWEICDDSNDIPVVIIPNNQPWLVFEPDELNFGHFDLPDGAPITREFTVTSFGQNPFPFEPTSCPGFQVEIDNEPIGLGEVRHGSITYFPAGPGVHECAIVFKGTNHSASFPLPCLGWAGDPCLITPDLLDFQNTGIGFPVTRGFTISNISPEVLEGAVTSPTGGSPFSVTSGVGPFSLSIGQSLEVAVHFDPQFSGTFSAVVDLGTGCNPVQLTGVGVQQVPDLELSATQINFIPTYMGYDHQEFFTITNHGDVPYEGQLTVYGDGFFSSHTEPFLLEPVDSYGSLNSQDLLVSFSPPGTLVYGGAVSFSPSFGSYLLLNAEGLEEIPAYTIEPSGSHFGFTNPGAPSTRTVVIHNEGPERLVGRASLVFPNENPFSLGETAGNFDLFPGQDYEVEVSFTGEEGSFADMIDMEIPEAEEYLVSVNSSQGTNQAEIGVFFDIGQFEQNHVTALAGTIVNAYVVAKTPTPITGWEACLEILGPNQVLDFYVFQDHPNSLEIPCFSIEAPNNFGSPEGSILAIARLLIACDDCFTKIRIYPTEDPLIPGTAAFWLPYEPFPNWRIPIQAATSTGEPLVATINSPFIESDLLKPMAAPENPLPTVTAFTGNYPNPFNPSTAFSFDLAEPAEVSLKIYDLAGRCIRNLMHQQMPAGSYEEPWQGRTDAGQAAPSGVYFARLQVGPKVMMRKIALLK